MINCNDSELLHKAYLYLDKYGKNKSWYSIAEMFGIKNINGENGGNTLRLAYGKYKIKHRNPDVVDVVGHNMSGASKIKEYETYY